MPSLSLPFLRRKSPAETAQGFVPASPALSLGLDLFDRAKESTATTGTGSLMLLGVAPGPFQSFISSAAIGTRLTFATVGQTTTEWEVCNGVLTAADTLTREFPLDGSSGKNTLVNFSSGTKDVFQVDPAAYLSPRNTRHNVKAFGAKGDVISLTDGQMTAGSALLTCPSGPFKSTDTGKLVSVQGPGTQGTSRGVANWLLGTIASYQSPTQVTLSQNATLTFSGCQVYFGTDDAIAINAATKAAAAFSAALGGGGEAYIPAGIYFVSQAVNLYAHTNLVGAGRDITKLMLAPGAVCDIIKSDGFDSLTGTNSTSGIYACTIKNLSVSGNARHGGFAFTSNSTTAILQTDTTITVDSTAAFPSSGTLLLIGDAVNPGEIVSYTGKTATTFTGVTRGQENTVAIAASAGITIALRSTGGVRSSGYGIRIYGFGFTIENVGIADCLQDGLYSEWSTASGQPDPDGIAAYLPDLKIHSCSGHGITWSGPHDAHIGPGGLLYSNACHGIRIAGNSSAGQVSGTKILGVHVSGSHIYAYSLEGFVTIWNCIGEQAISAQCYVNTSQTQLTGCRFFADPTSVFTRGIVMAGSLSQCVIDATITDCNGGAIDFTGDGGSNYVRINGRQLAGGNLYVGAPNGQTNLVMSSQIGNVNQLSGQNSQMNGPCLIRSGQGTLATNIIRGPFNLSANLLEGQLAQFPGGGGATKRFAFDNAGNLSIGHGTPTAAVHAIGGSMKVVKIADPAAPTGTAFGGSGTNIDYFVVAEDIAGNKTLASAKVTVSGGATLSATVFNRIHPADIGAYLYRILKTNTSTLLGTIQPNTGGTIGRINVTAGGSGYTGSAPTVGLSGPIQNMPLASAAVSGGLVVSIQPQGGTAYGSGFTSVPNVVIGGPGNGAAATAVMGVVNNTSFGNAGSGYAVGDEITLTGGTFTTATVLKVSAVSGGAITQVQVKTLGAYSVLPSNPVAQGSTTGAGTSATFNVNWGVAAYTVTNSGTGYNSAPSIGLNQGGALPTLTAILSANAVQAISVLNGTGFFLNAPTVVIQGISAGSGATASASLTELYLDDTGQATSGFTNPTRNATADATFDGNVTATAAPAILVGNMGVTTTAVSSTTTAETKSLIGTIVGTFTCPANFLIVGRRIRFKGHGNITTGGTASTIDFQIFFAGTKIASTGALAPTISQSNRYWEFEVEFVCITVGSSGTLFAQGLVRVQNAAAPVAFTDWSILGNNATPPAAVTVDTTASSLIDFKTVTGNNLHTITLNPGTSLEVMN